MNDFEKIQLHNFDDWDIYDGFAEGSGRSEKIWLKSNEERVGLFKFPKSNNGIETKEYLSEHLAYEIGKTLNIKTATIDIGYRDGRIGSMSYLIAKEKEFIIEGVHFLEGNHPDYNSEIMQEMNSKRHYCLDHLLEIAQDEEDAYVYSFVSMMLFDFLIGNSDRHQSNWAFLCKYIDDENLKLQIEFCPLYDNGSSLCCYVNESDIDSYIGKDLTRFNSLVDSKSKSLIRIDGFNSKRPQHSEMVRYLMSKYLFATEMAQEFVDIVTVDTIDGWLNIYPDDILSEKRKILISRFLIKKIDILKTILKER